MNFYAFRPIEKGGITYYNKQAVAPVVEQSHVPRSYSGKTRK